MSYIDFEWDINKAIHNLSKHGISFEEASTVFDDEYAILFSDPDHSDEEQRFLLIGMSSKTNLLVVCHCARVEESVIRIISARKATKTESKQYEDVLKGW